MELSKRYQAKAEENARQAEALRRKTARARSGFLPLLIVTLIILACWTAYVFVGIGASWWMALPLSFLLHAGVAFLIHKAFLASGRGETGRAVGAGMLAGVLLLAFVCLACFRAYIMIQDGNDPLLSWLMAMVYNALETALPIGMGAEYAHRCEYDNVAQDEVTEAKQLAFDIREDIQDAPGIWQDKEARLEHEITELRRQDTGTAQEKRKLDMLTKRLRRLQESHPGKRFHELAGTPKSDSDAIYGTATSHAHTNGNGAPVT